MKGDNPRKTSDDVASDARASGALGEGAMPGSPIVAIGASAGGFEAFREFLTATPTNTGACFIFVQHLDPAHKSMLPELLSRATTMEVMHATSSMTPEPNTVVMIPPDATLVYVDGVLQLETPAPPPRHRAPIDTFFASTATTLGENAICILLSGTGSDGTHGLALVKEAGGLTLAQEPRTAKFDSMPRNAIATGFVDFVLPPAEMPALLVSHLEKLVALQTAGGIEEVRERLKGVLSRICGHLNSRTGHDFREYKEATLIRRIHRRMQILQIYEPSDYLVFLQSDAVEVGRLLRELLISVTGFFRDPQAFDRLAATVIEPAIAAAPADGHIRAWVPGCSTGEEAYTIAMLIHDRMEAADKNLKVQIFATDIDEKAVETARRGLYSDAILARVPEDFRTRCFRAEGDDEFRVIDRVREMCIFSVQSVIRDPPFSRLDLVSCRNVLIYMKPELQNRLIPIFHYGLLPGGALFLGPSENVSKHTKMFETIDVKWRIFRRKEVSELTGGTVQFRPLLGGSESVPRPDLATALEMSRRPATITLAERLVLDRLGPAFVVITPDREVLYTGGRIDRYLTVPKGAATQDILAMAKPDLRADIRTVIHRALAEGRESVCDDVQLREGEGRTRVRMQCVALSAEAERQTLVLVFHDCGLVKIDEPASPGNGRDVMVEALERELMAAREYLQSTTEELESSNEELKLANEELLSMNEELQSSNEELETSKEELQSVNEELETVNIELATKIEELSQSNADIQNLLESTQIATLFLDKDLRVRRFTPTARTLFHLIDSDVGRIITDIASRLEDVDLDAALRTALETHQGATKSVRVRGGQQVVSMRVLPYRTLADHIDGVVATFVDVTDLTRAQAAAERRAAQQDIVATLSGQILRGGDTREILEAIPAKVASLLQAEYAKLLRKNTEDGNFTLVSNFGFPVPLGTQVPGGSDSQAGFTIASHEPVIVEDLASDFRFGGPALLHQAGVRSGISTIIAGPGGYWGVIGVHSKSVRSFSPEDINFVQAIANVVSTCLQRESYVVALQDSQEQLTAALQAGELGVHEYDPRTGEIKWDALVRNIWGVPEDLPVDFQTFLDGVHPDDRPRVEAAVNEALDPSGSRRFDESYRVVHARTRAIRWVRAVGDVSFEKTVAVRLVGTLADITDRRQSEQHVKLLMREVNHRAKNLLAVVQAIARQTAKTSKPAEFTKHLTQRLQGLAASQDLIIRGDWRAVSMADLVRSQINHLGEGVIHRVAVSGEPIMLTTAAAQGIGLALHELATNALKYGALSNEVGHVNLVWERSDDGTFSVKWSEHGGPPVEPPTDRGFGSTVIQRMAASAVAGKVDLDFAREGLQWHLTAPDREIIYDGSSASEVDGIFRNTSFSQDEAATK